MRFGKFAAPHTKVLIEVPFESPFDTGLLFRRVAQWGLLAVTRPLLSWRLASLRMLFLMHEHINYFNTQSLEKMMAVAGVPGVQSGTYSFPEA